MNKFKHQKGGETIYYAKVSIYNVISDLAPN